MNNEILAVLVVFVFLGGLMWALSYALIDDPIPVKKHKPS